MHHSMSSITYLWCVVGAVVIALVVYYWPEREPRTPKPSEPPRESAGIATDGSESDGKPQGPPEAE